MSFSAPGPRQIPPVHRDAGQNGVSYPKRGPGDLAFRANRKRRNTISVDCIYYCIIHNFSYACVFIVILSN